MNESEKYRQFRNFMTNELGITREDIRAWTTQSVATEVGKLVGQLNIDDLVHQAIARTVRDVVRGGTSFYSGDSRLLREAVAKEIASKLNVEITARQSSKAD